MGQCKLDLYDHLNYGGHLATITTSLYNGHSDVNDRDASGKVTGDCKNTSWLGFEDPKYGGYAWLLGEGDSIPNFRDATGGKCDVEQHRFYKFHDKNNSIKKIDIPTENVNDGRMREDIKIYAKRRDTRLCQWATYPDIQNTSDGQFSANDSDQWLVGHNDKKGQPCPGGVAYWKGFQKVSCVYDVKSGPKLGRLQTLHGEIKNSFSGDPRKAMYTNLVNKYCNSATRLNDIISSDTSNNKCRDVVNAIEQAKEYCKSGDNIAMDNTFCTKEELGTDNYNQIAREYCEANPDKDFCGCYNVLNNKCLTEETKDLPGCKVTYPTRESINKMPAEYRSNFDGTDKCWGNVCAAGTGKYVPEGTIDALCSKTVAVCIADLDVGSLKESGVNIEQNCGSNNQTNQTTNGSTEGTPAPMRDNIPLETTTTSTPSPSSEDGDEEEKVFYEKPEVQIGTVASSMVSIFSCFMLIILAM
jgi:hypothetical protein